MVYEDTEQDMFYGGRMAAKTVSEATQQKVDNEIRAILDQQYALARKLLEENRDKVEKMARLLLEWETLDADQVNDIMDGIDPRPPKATPPSQPPKDEGPEVTESATAPV